MGYLPVYLALARAVEARNPYTFEHSVRVASLAVGFGRFLAWEAQQPQSAVAAMAPLFQGEGRLST